MMHDSDGSRRRCELLYRAVGLILLVWLVEGLLVLWVVRLLVGLLILWWVDRLLEGLLEWLQESRIGYWRWLWCRCWCWCWLWFLGHHWLRFGLGCVVVMVGVGPVVGRLIASVPRVAVIVVAMAVGGSMAVVGSMAVG